MKSNRVNPPIGLIAQVIPLKLFSDMVLSASANNVTPCVQFKAACAVHLRKILVTGLAIS